MQILVVFGLSWSMERLRDELLDLNGSAGVSPSSLDAFTAIFIMKMGCTIVALAVSV